MNWTVYEVFSVISGVILIGGGLFIWNDEFRLRDRLAALVGGAFLTGYGFYVAAQTSGTWKFPVVIFALPVLLVILLVKRVVSGRRASHRSAEEAPDGPGDPGAATPVNPTAALSDPPAAPVNPPAALSDPTATRSDSPAPVTGRRASRWLVPVIAAVSLVVVAAVAGAVVWSRLSGPGPRTTVVLSAQAPSAGAALETVRDVLNRRLTAAGFDDPDVAVSGADLVVTVAGVHAADEFRPLVQPGEIRFRKVLAAVPDQPTGAAPPGDGAGGERPTLAMVQARLGDAYPAAEMIDVAAVATGGLTAIDPSLDIFATLTPAEVAVLPYHIQFAVPQITCAVLDRRPDDSILDPASRAVACDSTGTIKYLLDVAKVVGADVAGAAAVRDSQAGGGWRVDMTFTGPGSDKWRSLTREAYENAGDAWASGTGASGVPASPTCVTTQPSVDGRAVCLVAVLLDDRVITAPAIQGVLSTQSTISGQFDEAAARLLAEQLTNGALPMSFEIVSVTSG